MSSDLCYFSLGVFFYCWGPSPRLFAVSHFTTRTPKEYVHEYFYSPCFRHVNNSFILLFITFNVDFLCLFCRRHHFWNISRSFRNNYLPTSNEIIICRGKSKIVNEIFRTTLLANDRKNGKRPVKTNAWESSKSIKEGILNYLKFK